MYSIINLTHRQELEYISVPNSVAIETSSLTIKRFETLMMKGNVQEHQVHAEYTC